MIRYVVFDFDGTLVDSKAVALSVYNQLAVRYGFTPIDASNLDALKDMTILQRFKTLRVPLWIIPFLTRKFLRRYREEIGRIQFVPGMDTVLKKLMVGDLKLAIASSNSEDAIRSFLENNQVTCVGEIHCSRRLFRKDKLLRKFLSRKGLRPSEIIYICDEVRDIDACRKLSIQPVWVSWGFETRKALANETDLVAVDTPEALLQVLGTMITL